jgi:outer membrane receptor protein involved in Fe transport
MLKALRILLVLFLLGYNIIIAGTTGKIAGRVVDAETNQPLPGVNIVLQGTSFGASTNENGEYVILNSPAGIHSLRFSMIGYANYIVENVRVIIDLTTNINAQLQLEVIVGSEVIIIAESPIVARDVSNSQMNISSTTIESLPVQSVDDVLTLQAGIEQGTTGILVRGGSSNQTVFMVDGLSQNDERSNIPFTGVSLSSVKEIQVQTGGFNAEYGNLRSGLVNVVTKEGNQNYSGTVSFRFGPAAKKHFGTSIYSPDSYFNRPYLDPEVAYTGTNNGAWDDYTQKQYPQFEGWNSISQASLSDNDPSNDLTPEGAKRLYQWQHRRQGDIKKPDYIIDMGFGGPVPFLSEFLGNLRFYLSFFKQQDVFIFPLSRDSYDENHTQLKLNSDISQNMKLTVSGLYGETHSVSPYTWTTTPTGRVLSSDYEIANLVNSNSGNSILYMPGYYSPSSIYRTMINSKFTHVLNQNSYYEIKVQHKISKYNTFQLEGRDTSRVNEPVPGYFVDEAPIGYWGYGTTGIDGMSMSGWMNLGRDDSKISTTSLEFDMTSQINQQNQLKAGIALTYNDYDINSGTYSPSFTTWTRSMVYQISPFRLGTYLQDKLEFEGFVMNAGLRLDYSAPNVSWYVFEDYDKNLSAGYGNSIEDDLLTEDAKGELYLSPRLGIAHPITDDSKLYFNYGHFRSEASSSYRFRLQRESNGLVTSIGDPTLELEKTVAYELGYSQNLLDMFLLNIAAYYKDITNQPGWVYYQNLNSTVQYNQAANNNYQDVRGFEITLSKTRGSWLRGFINYTYHVETSGYFGYTSYYEDPVEQRNYLNQNPKQERPLPRPFARANIEVFSPLDFGPRVGDYYPFEQISLNVLAEWKTGRYETYNPNLIPGIENNVQWVDFLNIDLRLSKIFNFDNFDMIFYLDISNLLDHKQLSFAGFSNSFDYNNYLESLNFSWEDEEEKGEDKIGDYRSYNVKYDPLEDNPTNNPEIKSRNDKRKETKSYIDMPNISSFAFLNPRKLTLGIKIDF